MSASVSLFQTPSFKPCFSVHSRGLKSKPLTPISSFGVVRSKVVRFSGLELRRSVFGGNMSELLRSNSSSRSGSFRSSVSNGDESIGFFEQEALVNGSRGLIRGGFESTLNKLSKWLVAAIFGAIILWRHDAEALWIASGSVLNSILSVVLKRILNQERPVSTLRSDPGMPSSHAQSIFFAAAFIIFSIVEWLGVNELSVILSGLVLAVGSYLSWLRVSQQLHTISQVLVGAILGSLVAIFWYWSWRAFMLNVFISFLWVRIIVVLGGVGFCIGFLVYVIRYWLRDER